MAILGKKNGTYACRQKGHLCMRKEIFLKEDIYEYKVIMRRETTHRNMCGKKGHQALIKFSQYLLLCGLHSLLTLIL